MASVKGNVLGNYRGKIGNLSARILKGRTVIAARPSSFNVSQTLSAVQARSKFSVTVTLINFILSLQDLFVIWDKYRDPEKRLRNTIFKHNYPFSGYNKPTVENIITPDGFSLPVVSAVINSGALDINLNALNTVTAFLPEEENLSLNCLIVFHNPSNPNDNEYGIISLSKEETGFDFSAVYTGSIPLDAAQQAVAAKYQDSIVLLAVSSKNNAGEIIQYSSTYSAAL